MPESARNGLRVDAGAGRVGNRAGGALGGENVVPARRAARDAGNEPVALLTRLLTLGDTLTRADVERADARPLQQHYIVSFFRDGFT